MNIVFAFSLSLFQQLRRELQRRRPRAGVGMRLHESADGTTLEVDQQPRLAPHAWQTFPAWEPIKQEWRATIRPGFVNTLPAIVQESGLDLLDPLASVTLREYRPIGNDESIEEATEFFQALGVRKNQIGDSIRISQSGGVVVADTGVEMISGALPPQRFLRACDITLSVARAALAENIQIADNLTTGQTVIYSVGYDTARLDQIGPQARIRVESKYEAPRVPTAFERVLGVATDESEDRIRLATVYLLSPPGLAAGAEPDATWTPYVSHAEFFNLYHSTINALPPAPPAPITLNTGLAAGVGDRINAALLDPLNEANTLAQLYLTDLQPEGEFWSV